MILSEETLAAYVDGELDAATRAAVEAAMAADPKITQRIEQHRVLNRRLRSTFDAALHEPVPERLLGTLHSAPRPAQVTDLDAVRAARTRTVKRTWALPEWAAVAASLLIGVVLGSGLLRSPQGGFFDTQTGRLLARGGLAAALSQQLASEQQRDAAVRIGLSFRDSSGNYCRTFTLREGQHLAGLACRSDRSWQLQMLTNQESGPSAGGAEPAGSALPAAILQAVKERIAGEPLDAAGEARARDQHWSPKR